MHEQEEAGGDLLRKEFSLRVLREREGLNCSRKLRTDELRVAGKSPGHGAEKGNFQV